MYRSPDRLMLFHIQRVRLHDLCAILACIGNRTFDGLLHQSDTARILCDVETHNGPDRLIIQPFESTRTFQRGEIFPGGDGAPRGPVCLRDIR